VSEEVEAMLMQMRQEAGVRDVDRAAIYVATVRPALAGARFVRREQSPAVVGEGEKEGRRDDAGGRARFQGGDEGRESTVEPKVAESTLGDAMMTTDGHAYKDPDADIPANSDVEVAASVADGERGPVDDVANEVARVRLVRRRARKQAKRQRVVRAQAKKKKAARDVDEEQQRVTKIQKDEWRQQADGAMRALMEHRQLQGNGQREAGPAPVRVSLVQRQHQRATTQTPQADDAVEYVGADDGLPTAQMEVSSVQRPVKLDSCARYTIAGTEWMQYGDRVEGKTPVDYVEGIGWFLLDVVGVWRFKMRSVFGEEVVIDACVVDGCTDEFRIGVDFMRRHAAVMDFSKSEVRYREDGRLVVIPFRTYDDDGGVRVATVRLVRRPQIDANTVTPVEVAVPARDGERGIFLPHGHVGAVMLAATVTIARKGRAWVPAINSNSRPAHLPSKKELGTWIPVESDVQVLSMNNLLSRSELSEWLDKLGDSAKPLEDEDAVNIGVQEEGARSMVMKLLRVFRKLTISSGDCPPATALAIHHHIDTGDAAPIMQKRRRQAQMEDEIIEDNVRKMLRACVIEEGNGAWGFPVVLVRKKDRGAQLFTTLDLRAGYWQILVAPEDRDKTAFTTKQGLYRFVRMPFGLTNAPSTFQRMMNGVLRGLTWTTCLVYLDDIVVFT
jgi:hypothetical protein